jgi:hypothetical protein
MQFFFVQYQQLVPVLCSPGLCVKFVSVPYQQLAPVIYSHSLCVQFVSVLYWRLAPVFCMQDSGIFLAELQHSFSSDYVLILHRV